jgi:hypothetical protein
VRAIAWVAGGAAFLTPLGALAASPKPITRASGDPAPRRVVRQVTRRVIVITPSGPALGYVGGGSGSTSSSGGGFVAPPAAPPVTSTGGS